MNIKIAYLISAIVLMAFGQLTGLFSQVDTMLDATQSPAPLVASAESSDSVTQGFGVASEVVSKLPPLIPILAHDGNPTLTSVLVDKLTPREIRFTVSYDDIPNNGYVPMVYTYDPDNCVDCADPSDVLTYPINEMSIVENERTGGITQYTLMLDESYCGAQPMTKRFKVVLADARPYLNGQNSIADYVVTVPFDQAWCQ